MKFTVIPQNTFQSLQLEAGVLLKTFDPATPDAPDDSDIICATTGGITVNCVPTYSDFGEDVDNCPANLLELKHLDSWECTVAFTSLAASPETIKLALGAADIDEDDETKIIPRRDVKVSDFTELWWVGDKADGGLVAVKIFNALSTGGFSLKTEKNSKGQVSVTLTGHVSIDAQDVVPMEFYSIDGEAEETLAVLTVSSIAGSTSGKTAVSYTGYTKGSSESLKYKIGDTAESVALDDVLTTGWTSWNGTDEIETTSNKKITVAVVVTATNKAKAAGSATTVVAV